MINLFSIVTIVCIGKLFFIKGEKNKFFYLIPLTFFYESYLEVGYFFRIGSTEVGYSFIYNLFLFVYLIVFFAKKRIQKSLFYQGLVLILSILIGNFLLIIFPTLVRTANINISWDEKVIKPDLVFETIHATSFNILNIFYAINYVLLFFAILIVFRRDKYKLIISSMNRLVNVILSIGIIEVIIKYIFKSDIYNAFLNFIFGISSSTYLKITNRGNGFLLQGFTQESSHYVYVLFILFFLTFSSFVLSRKKNDLYKILIIIFLLATSMSFSSLIYMIAILNIIMLWIFRRSNSQRKIFVATFQIILFILLLFIIINILPPFINKLDVTGFWGRRITSLFEEISMVTSGNWKYSSTSLEWSNRVRILSIYENLRIFLIRPVFGFGLGSVTSHSSTSMLLSGAGIISVFLWIRFNFLFKKIKKTYEYTIVIIIFLIVNTFNSLALRPFFDISAILFSLSIIILLDLKERDIG